MLQQNLTRLLYWCHLMQVAVCIDTGYLLLVMPNPLASLLYGIYFPSPSADVWTVSVCMCADVSSPYGACQLSVMTQSSVSARRGLRRTQLPSLALPPSMALFSPPTSTVAVLGELVKPRMTTRSTISLL